MGNKVKKIIIWTIILLILVVAGIFIVNKGVSFQEAPDVPQIKIEKSHEVAPKERSSVSLLFVGDMMFDRYIRQVRDKKGSDFIFSEVKDLLAKSDLVAGNLEGPISDNPSVSVESEFGSQNNYVFTFDPGVSEDLRKNNIWIVNIGNNHIMNFREEGLAKTKQYLRSGGVDFFGDPGGEKRIAKFEKNGAKIAFVSYDQFEKDPLTKTLSDIQEAKKEKADSIILYTHWGKEYSKEPTKNDQELGRKFIDEGVDLIIGSHPHIVQKKEEYKGKMIYYSLGNFIFDQYFDPETQKGLTVQVMIGADNKMTFKEFPVKMKNNGQTLEE
jgi:poly-gamma-glutamate synthesis protein (capsule biosynthesis protein)